MAHKAPTIYISDGGGDTYICKHGRYTGDDSIYGFRSGVLSRLIAVRTRFISNVENPLKNPSELDARD